MKMCPYCGAVYDDAVMLCPIDGYDLSSESETKLTDEDEAVGATEIVSSVGKDVSSYDSEDKHCEYHDDEKDGEDKTTWLCPYCGGCFSESVTICPIDGYDHSRDLKKKGLFSWLRRFLKRIAGIVMVLSVIAATVSIAVNVNGSEGDVSASRIDYLIGKSYWPVTMEERLSGLELSVDMHGWLYDTDRLATARERDVNRKFVKGMNQLSVRERVTYASNMAVKTMEGLISGLFGSAARR